MATPITCPQCGYSETQLARSWQPGCPQCYRTFSAQIETVLPKLQPGALWHPGKIPATSPSTAQG